MEKIIKVEKPKQVFRAFNQTDKLVAGRLREYLPSTLMGGASGVLFNMVDTVVVGRLIGGNALSAVSLANPFFVVIRMIIKMLSIGIGTCLSLNIGQNDEMRLERCKRANRLIMIYGFLFICLSQVLIGWMIMSSYSLAADDRSLVWAYMVSSMAGTPFYLISAICNVDLQVYGKMKSIARLTIMEQIINLTGDILLVRFAGLGIAGAGLATSIAQITRAIVTFSLLNRQTDIMKTRKVPCGHEIKAILSAGLPGAQSIGQNALQQWILSLVMVNAVGMDGVAVKAVCSSCYNLMNIAITAVNEAMRPVAGVMYGARDYRGGRMLLKNAMKYAFLGAALFEALFELFPGQTLALYGIAEPSVKQIAILRIFCSYFVLNAFISPLQTYLTATRQSRQASVLTALNGVFVFTPVVLLLGRLLGGVHIFWAYPVNALVAACYGLYVCREASRTDRQNRNRRDDPLVCVSLRPQDGIILSQTLEDYVTHLGIDRRTARHIGLVVEELTMYIKENAPDANIDMVLKQDGNRLVLVSFSDGAPMKFPTEVQNPDIPDHSRMLALMASTLNYRYIVGLNYLTAEFAMDR